MKDFRFEVVKKDKRSGARAGVIKTPHGNIKTPAFSPVGTKASVRSLSPEDIKRTGSQVVLGNAYHLYLQPGLEVLRDFRGFAPFMKWEGPTITDSGGYQVSFLWSSGQKKSDQLEPRITDKGVYFRSHIDGSKHLLTPEKSIQIQQILGADIIMAFDQPLTEKLSKSKQKQAFTRTLKWEERSLTEWEKLGRKTTFGKYQALFGIIQGERDQKLRRQSLDFILKSGFTGLAMGGNTIGANPDVTAGALDTITDKIPDDKPLHALGLGGGPEGIFEAVERKVDIFDNTSVTRMARTGLLFTYPEDGGKSSNKFRSNIKRTKYKKLKKPFSKVCECRMCKNFSAAYINHLMVSNELLGLRLVTIHNVTYINELMKLIRTAIRRSEFLELKKEWLAV